MKKWKNKMVRHLLIAGLICGGMVSLNGTTAYGEEVSQEFSLSSEKSSNLSSEEYESEKEKALAAGYTEEQFEAIMNIPNFEDEELISSEAANLTAEQQKIYDEARKYIGVPYSWGGKDPSGFDCSGLVQYVFKQAVNMNIAAPTMNQEKLGKEVSLNSLEVGDLLFWGPRSNTTHVAIYMGDNQYIHAPTFGQNVKIANISTYTPDFARRVLNLNKGSKPSNTGQGQNERFIHRMYNSNNGNHHYTSDLNEAISLYNVGWNYENKGWVAPASGTTVYRLYNPNNGRHHYTVNNNEKNNLVNLGWKNEGFAWYSGGSVPVYRMYNPHASTYSESHHYTVNSSERDNLIRAGWKDEGVAFYAVKQ
ncbi:cell wall-associated NlpC family hydrolase [Enterococcus sp. PF1-24]|uniref:NlpC/P60 family protein n=1 Tax=unclassified Enterococcus TaxID=2608891 RepID=UPI002473193E|nr:MULTISPECIES: NlpC/P60 family protein [unclassified Enterococcus]MDH6363361.1 cell wall-associated NlpC family hydrolase [Enterococcus sp. PFB1-1]MDH6400338.1 cell wall-associated NlpC family hydrolase [Enterococcus sp. PF1-24]